MTTTPDIRPFLLGMRNRHFLAADLLILAVSPLLALILRLDSVEGIFHYSSSVVPYAMLLMLCKPLIFRSLGLYSRYWPYASVDALGTLALSATTAILFETVLFYGVVSPLHLLPVPLPRSLPVLNGMITVLLMGAVRLAPRMLFALSDRRKGGIAMKPVIIAGAGKAGVMVLKELHSNPQLGMSPVAFVDDDPGKSAIRILGVPVAGSLSELAQVVKRYGAREVIIAMPTATKERVDELLHRCLVLEIPGRRVPGLFEILGGTTKVSEHQNIYVEEEYGRVEEMDGPRLTRLANLP